MPRIKVVLAVIKTLIGKLRLRPKWRREFLEGLGGSDNRI
jgi:hypothetical protein